MSLSSSTAFLAKRGVRAVDGPLNGEILDDGGMLARSIGIDGHDGQWAGFYTLKGEADGRLVYVWADIDTTT